MSGRYEGEATTTPVAGRERALELRVDIDSRYENSPVLGRVSGDLFQVQRIQIPGQPAQTWRVYLESWIVDEPVVTWSECVVEISGRMRYWRGIHPPTSLRVRIPWRTAEPVGPATVAITQDGGEAWGFVCARTGDWFRDMKLEVDICDSVNSGTILPTYDTYAHDDRPADLPRRDLSVTECFRETGVRVSIRAGHTIIDDSDLNFSSWSAAELHDAMEEHFSQYQGTWPNWEMWGLLAGQYDDANVGGIMFDAAAAYDGAGRPPDRQGFAVFRNHPWFNSLPSAAPTTQAQAAALRKYLYTWVHEAGHAFNFLHSWNKNRPDALSWMNYDWRYDATRGAGSFWSQFRFRFDDEELIHLRHGDRPAVVMGGDPWASGGHSEGPAAAEHLHAPPGAMSQLEGRPPLELLLRSKSYFEFMEPVYIEFRVRNLLAGIPLSLDTRMGPEYGGTTVYIRRPDGRVVEYDPILCMIGTHSTRVLAPAPGPDGAQGPDRYSESVFLSYGKYGFYFDAPGEYLVRAVYRGAGDLLIPSNLLHVRVGFPQSRAEDRIAQDYFSYQVGMNLYLQGSWSPHLQRGVEVIRGLVEGIKEKDSMLKVRLATLLAGMAAEPFHRVVGQQVKQVHAPQPEEALKLTEPVVATIRKEKSKDLNLAYHQLVRRRVDNLVTIGQAGEARKELATLQRDLKALGANPNVLDDIKLAQDALDVR